jgi:hypothetical protein
LTLNRNTLKQKEKNDNDISNHYRKYNLLKISNIKNAINNAIKLGWLVLAGNVCFMLLFYFHIDDNDFSNIHWYIGITSFIIIMALSFFYQTILIESDNKDHLKNRIYRELNYLYKTKLKNNSNQNENFKDTDAYFKIIDNIIEDLQHNDEVYNLYRQIKEKLNKIDKICNKPSNTQEKNSYEIINKIYPEINNSEKFKTVLEGLCKGHIPRKIVDLEVNKIMERKGLSFDYYVLPVSFFLFTYFAAFMVVLPLIDSIFDSDSNSLSIPLSSHNLNEDLEGVPFIIIQWGFLGGLVYTSIDLLQRFQRTDLPPKAYYNASFRILLAGIASIIVFFFYMSFGGLNDLFDIMQIQPELPQSQIKSDDINDISNLYFLLLFTFSIGMIPIQFLTISVENILSKIKYYQFRRTAGKRSIVNIEGIDLITSARLFEEGLFNIQQLSLCNPYSLSFRTKFSVEIVRDWKDQAILYLLTADILVGNKKDEYHLNLALNEKYGIRRFTDFKLITDNLITVKNEDPNNEEFDDSKVIQFSKGLGFEDNENYILKYLIKWIRTKGLEIENKDFKDKTEDPNLN